MNLERLENKQDMLRYNELSFWLILWKRSDEYSFLQECPSQILQQKLRDLERAFRNCFDKSQPLKCIPVFKKKGSGDGIHFPQGFTIDNRRGGKWYASIQVEQMLETGNHLSASEIGIDAGVKCFAAFSDGTLIQVDYQYTSQACSCCGYRAKENRKSQAVFRCQACGHEENADVNAAKNIVG